MDFGGENLPVTRKIPKLGLGNVSRMWEEKITENKEINRIRSVSNEK